MAIAWVVGTTVPSANVVSPVLAIEVPGLIEVAVPWVKGVVTIGKGLVGAQETWLGTACPVEGGEP